MKLSSAFASPRARAALLAALVLSSAASLRAAPEAYDLDPVHSAVTFTARTLFTPIPGSFPLAEGGKLVFDAQNPSASKVEAVVSVAGVNTLNTYRDQNITKKEGWFAAGAHPTARFVSTRWEKGVAPDSYRITGDLTLNGVTQEIVLEARHLGSGPGLEPGDQVTGWTATVTLDRTRFGITADPKIIATEIPVTIQLQGLRKTAPKS